MPLPGDVERGVEGPDSILQGQSVHLSICLHEAEESVFLLLIPVLRIRDFYPGSWFLSIPNLGSYNNNKRREKICCFYLFCGQKFDKIVKYFILNRCTEKFEPIDKKIEYFLPKKLSLNSQKYELAIRDLKKPFPGSRIPDPGVKKTPDPGSATLDNTKYSQF